MPQLPANPASLPLYSTALSASYAKTLAKLAHPEILQLAKHASQHTLILQMVDHASSVMIKTALNALVVIIQSACNVDPAFHYLMEHV